MINEQNNFSDTEGTEVSALLGTLRRVNAPGDFNFRVKARIAQGRPARARSSWATLALRLSLPAVVIATAGGYLGYRTLSSDNLNVAEVKDVQAASSVTKNQASAFAERRAPVLPLAAESTPGTTSANVTLAAATPSRTGKPAEKPLSTAKPESDRSGGSYDTAVKPTETINQPDIDDNDSKPVRKVIVSAAQFLSSSGVVANSAGSGGKITAVSGTAASAGLRAGDVIESVSVVSGTVRVMRDGKSLSFVIK